MVERFLLAAAAAFAFSGVSFAATVQPVVPTDYGTLIVTKPELGPGQSWEYLDLWVHSQHSGDQRHHEFGEEIKLLVGLWDVIFLATTPGQAYDWYQATIKKGETVRMDMGGSRLAWNSEVFAVDLGPDTSRLMTGGAPKGVFTLNEPGFGYFEPKVYAPIFDARTGRVVEESPEAIDRRGGLGQRYEIKAGQLTEAEFTFPDRRATLTIVHPTRNLPDAPMLSDCGVVLRDRLHPPRALDRSKTTYRYFAHGEAVYDVLVNGEAMRFKNENASQSQIQLQRIELNDVRIDKGDGTSTFAKGRYYVVRKDGKNWERRIPTYSKKDGGCDYEYLKYDFFETGTGLDVMPGVYEVILYYKDAYGKNQVTGYDLDLR